MKFKLYSHSYPNVVLEKFESNDNIFDANDHAWATKIQFPSHVWDSKENWMAYFLSQESKVESQLQLIIDVGQSINFRSVMSFGAGSFCREYLLKIALPQDIQVVACDFDEELVKKSSQFFPEIKSIKFDFFSDNLAEHLHNFNSNKIDLAFFSSSSYVLNDQEFLNLFRQIKDAGVKRVIDFHGGVVDFRLMLHYLLRPITSINFIRKIFKVHELPKFKGKFHGYIRSRRELIRLYEKSGFEVISSQPVGDFKFVAILKPKAID